MKKMLTILMILTAYTASSQNIIQITHGQAKDAIKTKQRLNVLEVAFEAQEAVISDFVIQVQNLRVQVKNQENINDLWQKNYTILESQFEAEKAKKPKSNVVTWVLAVIGSFGVGFFVGSL